MAIHCLKLGDALCFPRRLSVHGVRMDRSQPPLQHHGVRIDIAGWDPQAKEPASLENPLLFYSVWSYQATAQFSLTLPRLDH